VSRLSLCLLLAAGLAACKSTATVTVQVAIPGVDGAEAPASDVALVALPYDRDSLIAALEGRAPPRPSTAPLDSAFAAFRAPFKAYADAAVALRRLQDSVTELTSRRNAAAAADRPAAEAALRSAQASIAAAEAAVERERAALDAARARVAAADSVRAAFHAWRDVAWAGYDTITRSLTRFRNPVADTTDALGVAQFELRGGDWWITATAWDADDPNAEWYWNVPVTGDTIRLVPATGRRRTRY
jgi:hypothetical protein